MPLFWSKQCPSPVLSWRQRSPESGVSWVNEDGVSGINVPVEDASALAEAIHKICDDPELWKTYSKGARRRFYDVFTKDEMINSLINIYTELLNPSK